MPNNRLLPVSNVGAHLWEILDPSLVTMLLSVAVDVLSIFQFK